VSPCKHYIYEREAGGMRKAKLTAPQLVALQMATESPNSRLPLWTNYNVAMALWRHNYVDQQSFITDKGRKAVAEAGKQS